MGSKRASSLITGEEENATVSIEGKVGRKNFNWTTSLDAILISCMVDLVHKHQVENGSFKTGAFNELEVMMEQRAPGCGVKLDPHIRSRHKKLKRDFNSVQLLRNQSGAGWDERTCAASMENDAFEPFIKVHPICKSWNNKPLPNYYDLLVVFGKSGCASGRQTGGIADGVYSPSVDALALVVDVDGLPTPINLDDPRVDDFMEDMINEGVESTQRASTTLPKEPLKKKAKKKDNQTDGDIAIATEVAELKPVISKALEALGTILDQPEYNKNDEAALIKEIGNIEGLTRCQVVDAAMALVENDRKTRLFYALDNDEDRKYFIMNLLR